MDEDHLQCSFLLPDEEVGDDFPNRVFVFLFFFPITPFQQIMQRAEGHLHLHLNDRWMMNDDLRRRFEMFKINSFN